MTLDALLDVLEPLLLHAVYPGRRTLRDVVKPLKWGEQVSADDLREVCDVIQWHSTHGFCSEREAFTLVGEQLAAEELAAFVPGKRGAA